MPVSLQSSADNEPVVEEEEPQWLENGGSAALGDAENQSTPVTSFAMSRSGENAVITLGAAAPQPAPKRAKLFSKAVPENSFAGLSAYVLDGETLTFKELELNDTGSSLTAEFAYAPGQNYAVFVVKEENGKKVYNEYDIGSFDDEVMEGLFNTASFTVGNFKNTEIFAEKLTVISGCGDYSYGDYYPLGDSITLLSNTEEAINGYMTRAFSIVPGTDYDSLAVFKVVNGEYELVSESPHGGEDTAVYISFPYVGDGTYVVMAKAAPENSTLRPVTDLTAESGKGKYDGLVTLSFSDPNAESDILAYRIYTCAEPFTSADDENVCSEMFMAVNGYSVTLDLSSEMDVKYFAVDAVGRDGTVSPLSEVVTHNIKRIDSNGDGIDDFWLRYYNFEDSDTVAAEDPDFDGLTNLREYQTGTDPLVPDTDGDGLPDGIEVENELDPLVSDREEVSCNHWCHKRGIFRALWKIMAFFFKLFGISPYCSCGKAHY